MKEVKCVGARVWTRKELAILKDSYAQNIEPSEIAEQIDRSVSAIQKMASVQGLTKVFDGAKADIVKLVYKGEEVRTSALYNKVDFVNAIAEWYHSIIPAIKRGEAVTLELKP